MSNPYHTPVHDHDMGIAQSQQQSGLVTLGIAALSISLSGVIGLAYDRIIYSDAWFIAWPLTVLSVVGPLVVQRHFGPGSSHVYMVRMCRPLGIALVLVAVYWLSRRIGLDTWGQFHPSERGWVVWECNLQSLGLLALTLIVALLCPQRLELTSTHSNQLGGA